MKKLLFVDDEPRILDGLRRMLRAKADEWECHFVENVEDALNLLATTSMDAIVSDLNMPGLNGIEFLTILRGDSRYEFLPFLMLTGNGELSAKRTALEAGATDFLNKPCDFAELTARLRNAISLKDFQDTIRLQNDHLAQRIIERTQELEESRRDVVYLLAKAAETRDSDTGLHILRVGLFAKILAGALGLSSEAQERIFLASTLHDVGKIGISDEILRKPGPLSPEERATMEKHCEIGAQILSDDFQTTFRFLSKSAGTAPRENDLLLAASSIALHHHERWDGSGYPHGLSGEEIPMEARIVAVADVYDALRSCRPYKDAFTAEQALEMIVQNKGSHFDPRVVDATVENFGLFEETLAQFSDGALLRAA